MSGTPRTVRQAVRALLTADGALAGMAGGHFPPRFVRELRNKFRRQVVVTVGGETTEQTSGARVLEVTAFAVECYDRGPEGAEALMLEALRVLDAGRLDLADGKVSRLIKTGSGLAPVEDGYPEDGAEVWRATLNYAVTVEREKAG